MIVTFCVEFAAVPSMAVYSRGVAVAGTAVGEGTGGIASWL